MQSSGLVCNIYEYRGTGGRQIQESVAINKRSQMGGWIPFRLGVEFGRGKLWRGLSATIVSPAKAAEPIEMLFGTWTQVGPREHAFDGVT